MTDPTLSDSEHLRHGAVFGGRTAWSMEQGDALGWLASLPDDSVDLVVTSPPYVKARLYLEGGADLGIARGPEAWVAWMLEVCRELRRVCRGLVAVVAEGQTKGARYCGSPFLLMADLARAGFNLRKPCVFRRRGAPGARGDWWANEWEPVVCFTRPGRLPWSDPKATGKPPKFKPGGKLSFRQADGGRVGGSGHKAGDAVGGRRPNGRQKSEEVNAGWRQPERVLPGNVITCAVGGGHMGSRLAHENEAPFPESLVEPFVRCFCPPGGIVCDPFAGSGTTLAVAVR
jgi:site-specific DNA-methyltransferase (adenine-specific)